MKQDWVEVFAELGRRMDARGGVAASNVARGMLAPAVLAEWLGRYPELPVATPRTVLVVTAGNIPFVGMQDLVCVLAAGHRAVVQASSRDRDNMAWAVWQLLDIAPGAPVAITTDASTHPNTAHGAFPASSDGPARVSPHHARPAVAPFRPDAVIAMGGDAAVATIGARYAGVQTLLRGHRSSAAVLTGDETADELRGLADDVLLHSGLGCRNVSLVFVPRGYDFAPLLNSLATHSAEADAPSTDVSESARGDFRVPSARGDGGYRQARAMLRMGGAAHLDGGTCLLVEERDFSARPSVLNYTYYDDVTEVAEWIGLHDERIQCVAASPQLTGADATEDGPTDENKAALSHRRAVGLGATQHPRPWDYPDGIDTMLFLASI